MDFYELAQLIEGNCPEIVRKSWKPVQARGASRSKRATKFGGSDPFRGSKFRWPRCGEEGCGRKKSFICQINIGQLPDPVKRHIGKEGGLFQMFWCTATDDDCEHEHVDVESDQDNLDIRIIPSNEMIPRLQTLAAISAFENKVNTSNLPEALQEFVDVVNEQFDESLKDVEFVGEEKQIGSWEESEVGEIPVLHELLSGSAKNSVVSRTGVSEDILQCIDFYDGIDADPISCPQFGIKLGGYVAWCQGVTGQIMDYPHCAKCDRVMDVTFLQIVYDDLLVYDWEDAVLAVTLCPACGKPGIYWKCP